MLGYVKLKHCNCNLMYGPFCEQIYIDYIFTLMFIFQVNLKESSLATTDTFLTINKARI